MPRQSNIGFTLTDCALQRERGGPTDRREPGAQVAIGCERNGGRFVRTLTTVPFEP
jgi:hypothetical protein